MKRTVLITTAALALAAAPAFAQTPGATTQTTATTRSGNEPTRVAKSSGSADLGFVTEAAQGGMAEVELGKLAAEKAGDADVKKFGQHMVDDHSKANEELMSIAAAKNITLPSGLDAKDKALHNRLSKLSGAAFDRAYMSAMVNDHVKDVNAFKREASAGKDADVKAFAAKTLPTLQDHLMMARNADKQVIGTSGKKQQTKAIDRENHGKNGNGTPEEHTPTGDVPRTNF